AVPLAVKDLEHKDPEVRARALKMISAVAGGSSDFDAQLVLPRLSDPAWFVRLQAAHAIGKLRYSGAVETLGALLSDESWQVRNAAAAALTRIGDPSIGVLLQTLRRTDGYAKQTVCEEIQRTDFTKRLFEHLRQSDGAYYRQSREILETMASLNFASPLRQALEETEDSALQRELGSILGKKETG
ncbi:MAG: HEAT repeat domain-containing protein, partial [bacterium]